MSGRHGGVWMVAWLLLLLVAAEEAEEGGERQGRVDKLLWRSARPEKMWRIHSQIYHEMEALAENPTDVQLYSRIEVVCKNNEEPNSRWLNMWNSGVWDPMLEQGYALPVLPFYALVFPFNMSQVFKSCVGWAEKFGTYTSREGLPKPFVNVFWKEFRETGGVCSSHNPPCITAVPVIKIGYISSDIYRIHPVGKSINAVLRMHDRRQFEVYAFLLIPVQIEHAEMLESGTGGVLLSDISILSSAEGASTINDEGIHILIDLNGHTSGVRMEVFAYAPTPIVMHYMGFGATTGARYIHYFLADTAVSTPELSVYYTEKMAYLPATFYANSYRYDPDRLPYVRRNETFREERERADLPPDGVVLCNFNHLHKTSRAMWSLWAQILLRCRREQSKHRHALADVFLDNNEYNGGTTGLDSYWADVPIISAPQEKFSARYGASFNRGARMEILTARNGEDYVKIAKLIRGIRDRLVKDKNSTDGGESESHIMVND
ncbi:hypothetical protein GUITHDRAFT_132875 [Guillardia theta CCMP2712]|uniref:O-GlcNAc transferase C-terminal domain-containing protein n=1 Tax=Guillardia theta (strain CCMP2712) TaxID=905079 RepID=L1JZ48_GUITC|nr:hypothetical protein GUITHDRAFT_132875 [Guillardia theta CCMP2712]EKX53831.1 hypothetical protein GUITHDRAFT_132875 [Guillardia theta CCMP2712]|eukprot:XP_005840811.1 hypothetical protein GUITHDRAFT_132875 [Guillardia theta CCMP2712]